MSRLLSTLKRVESTVLVGETFQFSDASFRSSLVLALSLQISSAFENFNYVLRCGIVYL